MKTFEATVRLSSGQTTKVQVNASNSTAAVRQLEAQYGNGSVLNNYAGAGTGRYDNGAEPEIGR